MTRPLPMIPDAEIVRPSASSTLDDEPGFGALRTEKGHLPLEAMDVRARIDGLLSRVVVRQTFVNAFDEPVEAAYIFPLPDRSAVNRFRMMVAGREIEGVLEERGQAREDYDRAIAQGRRASIAEEDRPGVFNLRVGNLMPGERATVELTLCGVLPYADGEATFRFPLVVAPRYIPGKPLPGPSVGDGTTLDTDAVPDASRISPPVLLPGFPNPVRLSLEVELHDGATEPDGVRSSLHAVQERVLDGHRRIRILPGERLDRDFILRFRLERGIRSTLTLHPDADDRQQGTFALTIVPPAGSIATATRPRDVIFLLDRSGSMGGWKMVAARRALARMIDTLGETDRFAVVAFDSTAESPDTLPRDYPPPGIGTASRAVEYLATVDARGGTEIAEPLDGAVRLLESAGADNRDRILVLVTDGQVGNEDQILSMLGRRLDKIRTFTIGIDRAVNGAFLRRLAERGGGSCELVESEDRLDEVMTAIHRRIGTPVLSGLGLDARGLAIEPGEIVPRRLPDLFPGSPLLILGRYRGRPQGAIAIRGADAGGTSFSESVPAEVRENPAIAAAWARGQVRQLEDRYAAGDGERSALEKTIVGISLRFRVLCRFTAYVAIDRSEVVNEGGAVHRIAQAVESPEGWADADACCVAPMMARALPRKSRKTPPNVFRALAGGNRTTAPLSAPHTEPASPDEVFCVCDEAFPPAAGEMAMRRMELADSSLQDGRSSTPADRRSLAFRLSIGPRFTAGEAALVIADAAEAVQRLHDEGRFHGELDPSFILMDEGAPTSLLDASRDGDGSWNYRAPERIENPDRLPDAPADVYALGLILYETLTGKPVFAGHPGDFLERLLRGEVTPPRRIDRSIPARLEAICLKAMAREPSARYATAGELAEALRGFLRPRRKAFWR